MMLRHRKLLVTGALHLPAMPSRKMCRILDAMGFELVCQPEYTLQRTRAHLRRPRINQPGHAKVEPFPGHNCGSACGRFISDCADLLPANSNIDLAYLTRRTLFSDLQRAAQTVLAMLR